jgi:Zn2+/Cd2+-exporting ATPase
MTPPPAAIAEQTSEYQLSGLDCPDCAASLEKNLAALPGMLDVKVNFARSTLHVRHEASASYRNIAGVVEAGGYGLRPLARPGHASSTGPSFWLNNRRAVMTLASGLMLAVGIALQVAVVPGLEETLAAPIACLFAMALGGYQIARAGASTLIRSRSLDMNALMTIAAVGALAIGQWEEAATVVFLFSLGNTLESYVMDRARGAIRSLMALAPEEARVRRGDVVASVPADSVRVGEVVLVRSGERVPVDGTVVAGQSGVSQAAVTGESAPVLKTSGDSVFAGSVVEQGYLEIRATHPYEENTISRIIRMVEEAQSTRAEAQRFVDAFARWYTPAVIAVAVLVATVPWLAFGQPFQFWFYRALVLLVIACPCALVISTPVAIVSGIARAAKLGILIKGGMHLEAAARVRTVAFDKTGTLTSGRPEVTDVIALNGLDEDEMLHIAAALEARAQHPLASAIERRAHSVEHHGEENELSHHSHDVGSFESAPGVGVSASVDGRTYWLGGDRMLSERTTAGNGAERQLRALQGQGKTVLVLGEGRDPIGVIALADQVRPVAAEAVAGLRRVGIEHVVVLTGDNPDTAQAIAGGVGADDFRSQLLPEDKVTAVRELRARYGAVAMVGDGVNDAPALASADVSLAMGVIGSDVALETADIALMGDDLSHVPVVIGLARKTLGTIYQNVAFSLAIKAVFLALALTGTATLWMAIFADMGASLLVTLNGMRLLRYSDGNTRGSHK